MAVAEYLVANRKDAGMPGPQGPAGPAGVTSARGETLPPGSEVEVELHDRVLTVRVPRGDKGDKGDTTTAINNVTASVDNNVGKPSVDVTHNGPANAVNIDFAFHNLKGKHDGAQVWTGWEDPTVQHPDDVAEGDLWLKSQRYWTTSEGEPDNSPSLLADFYTYAQGEKDNSPSVLVPLDSVVMELLIRHNEMWSPMIWHVNTSLTPGATPSDQEPSCATPSITMSATVGNTVGTPSVQVTKGGTAAEHSFAFAFSNLKGADGEDAVVKTIPVTFEASLFKSGLAVRKTISGLGSVNMISPAADAENVAVIQAAGPVLAQGHGDDSSIPEGMVQLTVATAPTADMDFVITVLRSEA